MYKLIKIVFYPLFKLLFMFKVVGKQNFPKQDSCIVVCNHLSNIDVILMAYTTKRQIYFLGKKELFKNMFMRWLMKSFGVISIDRDNVQISSIRNIFEKIKNGKVIGIFPEGTRNKNYKNVDLLELKNGVVKIAEKSNAKIVPMFIPKKPKLFHINIIKVGEPFMLEKNNENNSNIIKEKILKLKN